MTIALPHATPGIHARSKTQDFAGVAQAALPGLQLLSEVLHMPFDAIRTQHAQAIHAGLMANSILESRDFEKGVDALEHICLGPLARHN